MVLKIVMKVSNNLAITFKSKRHLRRIVRQRINQYNVRNEIQNSTINEFVKNTDSLPVSVSESESTTNSAKANFNIPFPYTYNNNDVSLTNSTMNSTKLGT